jgi:FOG: TPR repeat, SEL1 subfamily
MKFRTLIFSLSLTTATLTTATLTTATARADVGAAVPLYEESELITLFETNSHLERVEQDECQLVQDIEARATRVGSPAYEFLYGDMLAWGVCVDQDADLGVYYMKQAAQQGLPAALEQIGRYYANGTLVQQDQRRAIPYLREAASLGDTRARIQLAELLVDDVGRHLIMKTLIAGYIKPSPQTLVPATVFQSFVPHLKHGCHRILSPAPNGVPAIGDRERRQ